MKIIRAFRWTLVLVAMALLTRIESAQVPDGAHTKPLKVWAYRGFETQLARWEATYTTHHPEVRFENTFHGAAAVMSGLYNGVADLALMGREIWPVETMAYRWVYRAPPFGLAIATAGMNAPGQSFTPVVIVNASNPLQAISIGQLDAIYGSEHRAAPANIRTWGELGLTGDWEKRPIHVYGFGGEDPLGVYFRHDVLRMDFKPNPESHLLSDHDGSPAADRIARAIANDPCAIGYTAAPLSAPDKILAVSQTGPAIEPDDANLGGRAYPMTRSVWLFLRRSNNEPVDARVDGFVRFILSHQGQALVQGKDGLLPLAENTRAEQLRRLAAPLPAPGAAEE